MSSYELLTKLPVLPIIVVLIAVIVYTTFNIYLKNRAQKGVGAQILLYSLLAFLFAVDFFLFLRRDGFRPSWSLMFWLALAAFMAGERVGRFTSTFDADEEPARKDAG
jgi:hypothetical protein